MGHTSLLSYNDKKLLHTLLTQRIARLRELVGSDDEEARKLFPLHKQQLEHAEDLRDRIDPRVPTYKRATAY